MSTAEEASVGETVVDILDSMSSDRAAPPLDDESVLIGEFDPNSTETPFPLAEGIAAVAYLDRVWYAEKNPIGTEWVLECIAADATAKAEVAKAANEETPTPKTVTEEPAETAQDTPTEEETKSAAKTKSKKAE